MCKTKEKPIATEMNFNIRILYWRKPLKTQEKQNNYDTTPHSNFPLNKLINLSHQLAVMIFPTQSAMEHFGLLSPRLQHTPLLFYSFTLSRCSPWPTSSTNSKHRKDWFRNRWKMCNFLKYPFIFFAFARQVIGALFFLVYFFFKYCNLFCFTPHTT